MAAPLAALPGVGPARQRQLAALGLRTVEDVIRYVPRRHEDRTRLTRLGEVQEPGVWTVAATVLSAQERRAGRVLLLRARLADDTGVLPGVWFNQPHLRRVVVPGARLLLHGPAARDRLGQLELRSPEVEALEPAGSGAPGAAGSGLLPVYALGAGWTQRALRALLARAVAAWADRIPETLPPEVLAALGLVPAARAWHHIHLPPSPADLDAARRRLVFEELFLLQLGLLLRRRERAGAVRGFRHPPPGPIGRRFRAGLPFRLTAAQERVLAEIDADLVALRPMYRLVQGDVGSGKTVVAAAAMLRAVEGGHQAALLAPTEILAEQHYLSLRRLCAGLCRVELLTGSTPRAARRALLEALAAGRVDVVVGTHALLQADVRFAALAMAVTDEQHRFGVRQRDLLAAKGDAPDVLVMTATPIPRSLAMTLYGDLDVSVIDELPPGRRPVRTFQRTPASRDAIYAFVRQQVGGGRQAFVVCPLISPAGTLGEEGGSEADQGPEDEPDAVAAGTRALAALPPDGGHAAWGGGEPSGPAAAGAERTAGSAGLWRGPQLGTGRPGPGAGASAIGALAGRQAPPAVGRPRRGDAPDDADGRDNGADGPRDEAESAEAWAAVLAERMPEVRVGLLHGRMPLAARERTMAAFVAGDIQVLVATTVIEVGVDVPNATVLVVEGADRFGLAQLHQLRGRVGRGGYPSYCILVGRDASQRLEVLTRCRDGFVIAEEDLRQRGPGEVLGTRQHGLPELTLADPLRDGALLTEARAAAAAVLARDPVLGLPQHAALRRAVAGMLQQPRG